MKRIVPLVAAVFIFAAALFLMRPEPTQAVLSAASDLPAGHELRQEDLAVRSLPKSLVPPGAILDPADAVGKKLSSPRTAGDLIFTANLGGENLQLAPDERALAVHVTDSAGIAGLLKAGDRVGLTATFLAQTSGEDSRGAYAKQVASGLRVLFISPEFRASDPLLETQASGGLTGGGAPTQRAKEGVVVLAVPAGMQAVTYDFTAFESESQLHPVYLIDLLPALDQSRDVALSLILEPLSASQAATSGVFLPDLVLEPGPSPTPTTSLKAPSATPTPWTGPALP